jgi:hypothetical protein
MVFLLGNSPPADGIWIGNLLAKIKRERYRRTGRTKRELDEQSIIVDAAMCTPQIPETFLRPVTTTEKRNWRGPAVEERRRGRMR